MLSRYGAAGILIHHENKDKDAKGINKVSGSARIVAATWGIWQLMAADPNNDKNPTRWLKVKPREGESTTLTLEINPKDLWASQGIFSFVGEFGDESGEKRTQGERVLELLRKYSPLGLEYQEIDRYLNVGKSLYTVLDRLEDRQLITKRRSKTDARRWVYCLPNYTTDEGNTTKQEDSTSLDTPPPSSFSGRVELIPENTTGKEVEVSQQLFNTHSTTIQHPEIVDKTENDSILHEAIDTEAQPVIQHTTKDEGERGVVEQEQSVDVLQTSDSEENQSEKVQTKNSSQEWIKLPLLQVGDRIIDVLTKIQGVVVGVDGERVIFHCREFGRVWRERDLVVKISR
jgi:hypothetical protein